MQDKVVTFAPNSEVNLEMYRVSPAKENPLSSSRLKINVEDQSTTSVFARLGNDTKVTSDPQRQLNFQDKPAEKLELIEYETVKQQQPTTGKPKNTDDSKKDDRPLTRAETMAKQGKAVEVERQTSKPIARFLIVGYL